MLGRKIAWGMKLACKPMYSSAKMWFLHNNCHVFFSKNMRSPLMHWVCIANCPAIPTKARKQHGGFHEYNVLWLNNCKRRQQCLNTATSIITGGKPFSWNAKT